jgi:MarR family transcriptional regulator, organic hydroperoxide resistance regulator
LIIKIFDDQKDCSMATELLIDDLLALSRLLHLGRHADMTPQQYWLLRHLQHHGPTSISELAHALTITTGSATVACQRLEKAAFVKRTRQVRDERIVQVALTEQGQSLIAIWRQQRREALTHLISVLDECEQAALQNLIARLLTAAEAHGLSEEGKTR